MKIEEITEISKKKIHEKRNKKLICTQLRMQKENNERKRGGNNLNPRECLDLRESGGK